jgi:hypothetical protein
MPPSIGQNRSELRGYSTFVFTFLPYKDFKKINQHCRKQPKNVKIATKMLNVAKKSSFLSPKSARTVTVKSFRGNPTKLLSPPSLNRPLPPSLSAGQFPLVSWRRPLSHAWHLDRVRLRVRVCHDQAGRGHLLRMEFK